VNRAPRRPLARVGFFFIDQCLVWASIAFVVVVINGALALTGSAQ
jgi:hypothetical protein